MSSYTRAPAVIPQTTPPHKSGERVISLMDFRRYPFIQRRMPDPASRINCAVVSINSKRGIFPVA